MLVRGVENKYKRPLMGSRYYLELNNLILDIVCEIAILLKCLI